MHLAYFMFNLQNSMYMLVQLSFKLFNPFLWPLRFGWLLVIILYKEDYLQIFKFVSF